MSIFLDWDLIKKRKSRMQIMHPFIPAISLTHKKNKSSKLLKIVLLNNAIKYSEVELEFSIDDYVSGEIIL